MDRYTKAVLTVIAGCLLVLVGAQVDFPAKAVASDAGAGGGTNAISVAVDDLGNVYFANDRQNVIHCKNGECVLHKL